MIFLQYKFEQFVNNFLNHQNRKELDEKMACRGLS